VDSIAAAAERAQAIPSLLLELLSEVEAGVAVVDVRLAEQPLVYVNPSFERITGYPAAEVLGRNCRLLQGEGTSPLARELMRETIRRGDRITVTALNYRRDGTAFDNEIRLVPLRGKTGEPSHYLGLLRDVSAHAGEDPPTQAEVLRSSVFESLSEGLIVLDNRGAVADVNPSALSILGLTREELAQPDWWSQLRLRQPDGRSHRPADSPGLTAFQQRRRISDVPLLLGRGDGEERLVLVGYTPYAGAVPDRPGGLVVSLRDETDRRRDQRLLQQFATLLEVSDDVVIISGLDHRIRYLNQAGRRLLGLGDDEELGDRSTGDLLAPDAEQRRIRSERHAALARVGRWSGESTLRHVQTGETIPVRLTSYLVRDRDTDEPLVHATVARDISRERQVTAELRRGRERYETQFRSLPLPVYVWERCGEDYRLRDWNSLAEQVTRGGIRCFRDAPASEFFADNPEIIEMLERCERERTHVTREMPYRQRTSGDLVHVIATCAWVPPNLVLVHTLDITERVVAEQRLKRLAEHDDLTGLYNRRYFESRLGETIGREDVAVLIIDVDHFKFVNDSLGHAAGDELLREVTATMSAGLRRDDVLARFGGDEFAVLLTACGEAQAQAVGNHLLAGIRANVTGVSVTASAGAAVFAAGSHVSASDAIVAADIALYEAKQHGRDRIELYSGQRGVTLTWVQRIRRAIETGGFVLHAQPVCPLRADPPPEPMFELLVRMRDDAGEIIPPGSFLPTAEQFGLIREIDRWVTGQGIALAAAGNRVSINLSARSLADPGLAERVRELIERHGAPPSHITFEFTETAAISSIEDARALTLALRELGCQTALDDFGTGFGSFVLVKHIPVDALKIDAEFVRDLAGSEADQRIVAAIVQIAQGAGMRTVAEGIEDAGALAIVRELGVDYAQGYHLGRPACAPGQEVAPGT
jgi:diguanylate cyclase (GGDEF)-like protein/PAS domain S-box-containing protein